MTRYREPASSVLDLTKITDVGFDPPDAWRSLERYLRG